MFFHIFKTIFLLRSFTSHKITSDLSVLLGFKQNYLDNFCPCYNAAYLFIEVCNMTTFSDAQRNPKKNLFS